MDHPLRALAARRPVRTVLAVGLFGALASCSNDSGALRHCRRLVEAESFVEAAAACRELHASKGDPEAGILAARADAALGDREAIERWTTAFRGTSSEAEMLEVRARFFRNHGETERAREAYVELAERARRDGALEEASTARYQAFVLAWELSDWRSALDNAQHAFVLATEAGERHTQGLSRGALSLLFAETGDVASALVSLEESADYFDSNDVPVQTSLLVNQGALRFDQGRIHLARDAFEQALALAGDSMDARFYRSVHLNLAESYLLLGQVEEAGDHIAEAWKFADEERGRPALLFHSASLAMARGEFSEAQSRIDEAFALELNPTWQRKLSHLKGRLEERLGNDDAAEAFYRKAIEVVQTARASLGVDALKAKLLDDLRRPYEDLFRLYMKQGRVLDALDTAEHARSRTFLDALVAGTTTDAVADADADADASDDPVGAAVARLDLLDALLPSLRASDARELRPIADVLDVVRAQVVLAYFVAGDELWLIATSNGRARSVRLTNDVAPLGDMVRRFEQNVGDERLATRLGRMLLPPEVRLEAGSALHIVTDGIVGRVPFAALIRDGRYLVESFVPAYVPSLNAIALWNEETAVASGPPVVLADPIGDLPEAVTEARAVAAALGVTPRIGPAATLEALRAASGADVLHLATHTGLSHRGPWLQLAEGRMEVDELFAGHLTPRLVVLASCASAARESRGLWGALGTAFLAAGSRHVVASLGSVEDVEARHLMERFYALGGARAPARALAEAQRELVGRGSPVTTWAPFVHLGVVDLDTHR